MFGQTIALRILLAAAALTSLTISAAEIQPVPGDPSEYHQKAWTTEDGLPSNKIQALCQTRDGYLWIGTRAGLVRFDGIHFTLFDHVNTPEMTSDDCRSLVEDTEGALWIGTSDGLLRLHQGRFSRYSREHGLVNECVGLLCASRRGDVWTGGNFIDAGQIRRLTDEKGNRFEGSIVSAMTEDAEGTVWIGKNSGVLWFDRVIGKYIQHRPYENVNMGCFGLHLEKPGEGWGLIHEDRGHRIRLYRFNSREWTPATEWLLFRLQFDPLNLFLKADRARHLWFPAFGGHMHRFANGQLLLYPRTLGRSNDTMLCFLEDLEGNLWLGTDASGLHRWRPRSIRTLTTRDGLPHDHVWTVFQSADDSLWIGTESGAVQMKDGQLRYLHETNGLTRDDIKAFVENESGLWIGTGGGLNLFRENAVQQQRLPGEHPQNKVRAFAPAPDGALWIGTVQGLHRIHHGQSHTWRKQDGLANEDIRALLDDASDGLWIGTAGGGLHRLRDGRFEHFTTTKGLPSDFVWSLHRDAEGVLWIGTERGLARLVNGRVFAYGARHGLLDDHVNQILEDDFGNLWLGSERGVHRVSKKELAAVADGDKQVARCVSYDESDGLPKETSGQVSQPAACKTRDGRLWFSTAKGVAIIDPQAMRDNDVAPLIVIEEVRANDRIIYSNRPMPSDVSSASAGSTSREKSAPAILQHLAAIVLPPGGGRTVEFQYTANTFVSPEKTRFRYRLEGYEEEWHDAATRRAAYYTNLRPGRYQFRVIARNSYGVWNEDGAMLAFSLAPFYWQTWWFRIGCGVLLAGTLALLAGWRFRELRRVHELEREHALEQQKRIISRDLHDEIGSNLTQIARLAESARSDETSQNENPNARVSDIAAETIGKLGELVWSTNPHFDNVPDLVAYLREYAARYLEDTGLKARLDFPEKVEEQFVSSVVRRQLLLILKEALNNVARHAEAKTVHVCLAINECSLELSVTDDGRGILDESASRFGNGLTNMRQRVEELGGKFAFTSASGRGTRIEVSIPLA